MARLSIAPNMKKHLDYAEMNIDQTFMMQMPNRGAQVDLYNRKIEEAKLVLAGEPAGPLILAEMRVRNLTAGEIADGIMESAKKYSLQIAEIEEKRLLAKRELRGAITPADIKAVLDKHGVELR